MTEKRFSLAYEIDNWWAVRDGEITLWKEEVISLLNELNDEKQSLKEGCEEYRKLNIQFKERINELISDNTFLQKENKQLKQSFDKSLLSHTKTCDDYRALSKKNKRLKEKNEELKKKILEEIDLEIAYIIEVYFDGKMSEEQYNGAIISLRLLREKFE